MKDGGVRSDMLTSSGDCHTKNDNVSTSDVSHEHGLVSVRSSNQRTAATREPIRELGDRDLDRVIKYDSINRG